MADDGTVIGSGPSGGPVSVPEWSHPVMACQDSKQYERQLLGGSVGAGRAMELAGRRLGREVRWALNWPHGRRMRMLVLLGRGMNAGDALIACLELIRELDNVEVHVVACYTEDRLDPVLKPWWRVLRKSEAMGSISIVYLEKQLDENGHWAAPVKESWQSGYDLCLDGIFGMSFRPPLGEDVASLLRWCNGLRIRMRVAVDLPSGVGEATDPNAFRADITYATGVFKSPLMDEGNRMFTGRCRYIDLGFFEKHRLDSTWNVLVPGNLLCNGGMRSVLTDKRSYGHLLIMGGSARMPGALLMAVQAAVRSGVGLVTVAAPQSIYSSLAAQVPEAMWIPWEETADGGLALEGLSLLREMDGRIDAFLIGPGMGRGIETQALIDEAADLLDAPLVLDADALMPDRVKRLGSKRPGSVIVTPHRGEYARLSGVPSSDKDALESFRSYCSEVGVIGLLKGPLSIVAAAGKGWVSAHGGPVLARGGSGDMLAGLVGGAVASSGSRGMVRAVCRALVLQGSAADALASRQGECFVRTTSLLEYLNRIDPDYGQI